MLTHNLKIAFRNLLKYKTQSVISIIGLAVGFTCFALATLWIRYEMSYDKFHRDAELIYVVYQPSTWNAGGLDRRMNFRFANHLKETFPEISEAAIVIPEWDITGRGFMIDDMEYRAHLIQIDSALFNMFDIRILEGSRDFLIPHSNNIAITQRKARQWFGDESPIGKEVGHFRIVAVVAEWNQPSNFRFDVIQSIRIDHSWNSSRGENALIKLYPSVDAEAFKKKMAEFHWRNNFAEGSFIIFENLTLIPITKMRYQDTNIQREVKFQYIVYFAIAGLLVIFCSLFNYLTLFVSRFRIRQKELALRMVCGASGLSLFILLSVEFLLTLIFAFLLGLVFQQLALPVFLQLAEIQGNITDVYGQLTIYVLGVILLALLFFWLILFIFRKRSLNMAIRKSRSNFFRHTSIVVQLIISIGFIFCTSVLLKQIHNLHNTSDLGFSFKNIANVSVWFQNNTDVLVSQLKEIPEITDILQNDESSIFPFNSRSSSSYATWDDKPEGADMVSLYVRAYFAGHIIDFYNIQLLEGEWLNENDSTYVLINEAAVKAFGWSEPIGKSFGMRDGFAGHKVKGVIRNIHNLLPTMPPSPAAYSQRGLGNLSPQGEVQIKYGDGIWESAKAKIESMIEKEYPDSRYTLERLEDVYSAMLKSEAALLKILGFVSLVCILISVFGFFSLVSLACEDRRKEIAIRKVNGATMEDILLIFFKEYFLLLVVGALIAFPIGYYIMKRWLEQYTLQTAISAWIYIAILFALTFVIVLCVGWRVWRTSRENPAEVLKSE